ncbi:MAG: 4-oxalocrotonate tautomerase family protein [Aigarchaeota archaeon]|nr:4-oxalocrotonate tautomerase family protein [Candidatus Pelearchaeum maunauluense]
MPLVHIYMAEGRSEEQKREMVRRVAQVIRETINPRSSIEIVVHEIPRQNIAIDGKTLAEM